jgi:cell division transport system permease protein
MRINMVNRHVKEGVKSLFRNGWMSFASISAVAITLLILGFSLVFMLNANQMSSYVANQLTVTAFLQPKLTDTQGQQVGAQVRQIAGVKSVQVITKEAGMKSLSNKLGGYQDVLSGMKDNPLPVQLVVQASNPKQTVVIGNEVKQIPGVQKMIDGETIVSRVFRFLDTVRDIGLVFVIALLFTAMFLISNTIKITILNRRNEIEIMKLVGATNWFVRWPFLVEAILIGAIGTLIPYAILTWGYEAVYTSLHGSFVGVAFSLLPVQMIAGRLAVIMFGIGVFVGLYGGVMSIRKFLRV